MSFINEEFKCSWYHRLFMNEIIRDHNHESSWSTEVNTNMEELVTLHPNLRN